MGQNVFHPHEAVVWHACGTVDKAHHQIPLCAGPEKINVSQQWRAKMNSLGTILDKE